MGTGGKPKPGSVETGWFRVRESERLGWRSTRLRLGDTGLCSRQEGALLARAEHQDPRAQATRSPHFPDGL